MWSGGAWALKPSIAGVIEAKESNLRISLEYHIRVLIIDWTAGTGPFSREHEGFDRRPSESENLNEKLQTAIRGKPGAHARQRRFGDPGLSVQESGRSFVTNICS